MPHSWQAAMELAQEHFVAHLTSGLGSEELERLRNAYAGISGLLSSKPKSDIVCRLGRVWNVRCRAGLNGDSKCVRGVWGRGGWIGSVCGAGSSGWRGL